MGGSRAVDRAVRQIELLRAALCQHIPRHFPNTFPLGFQGSCVLIGTKPLAVANDL
jgi:hypothetical protein